MQYIDELLQIAVNDDPADTGEDDCETVYYSCHNANFNVLGIVSDAGELVERYEYTPYGQRLVFVNSGTNDGDTSAPTLESTRVVTTGTVSQPYGLNEVGHQGLLHDKETTLIYNRARMHHPRLGRFMQRDPLGYQDGSALQAYHAVHPSILDPSGAASFWEWLMGVGSLRDQQRKDAARYAAMARKAMEAARVAGNDKASMKMRIVASRASIMSTISVAEARESGFVDGTKDGALGIGQAGHNVVSIGGRIYVVDLSDMASDRRSFQQGRNSGYVAIGCLGGALALDVAAVYGFSEIGTVGLSQLPSQVGYEVVVGGQQLLYRMGGGNPAQDVRNYRRLQQRQVVEQRILASRLARENNHARWTEYLVRERTSAAQNFMRRIGWSESEIRGALSGIDAFHPVSVDRMSAGTKLMQYTRINGRIGEYFTYSGSGYTPSQLGISGTGRVPVDYVTRQPMDVLRSTSAPVIDYWTVKGAETQTEGGGVQLLVESFRQIVIIEQEK